MPIYEYKCGKCNKAFSVLQRVGATEKDTVCSECGSKDVKKQMSSFCCSAEGNAYSPSASHGGHGGG
ncbi:MAG: zinc ribbon domain-containing protein [Nitrospirae bacterium]|nr:MAG: zinc ribbon domain-containing protein [Nitrospirota bacterium]